MPIQSKLCKFASHIGYGNMCRFRDRYKMEAGSHLNLLRPEIGEGSGEELRDLLVHVGRIVGEGGGPQGSCVPQGRLDSVLAHDAEQVMQDLRVHLEAWLVEGVCAGDMEHQYSSRIMTMLGSGHRMICMCHRGTTWVLDVTGASHVASLLMKRDC